MSEGFEEFKATVDAVIQHLPDDDQEAIAVIGAVINRRMAVLPPDRQRQLLERFRATFDAIMGHLYP